MVKTNVDTYDEDARLGARIRKIINSGKDAEARGDKGGKIKIYSVEKHIEKE